MQEKAVIYIHGKGGSTAEAEHYKPFFKDCDVLGLDYKSETPWEAKTEFSARCILRNGKLRDTY